MSAELNRVVGHTIATLPDSLSQRKSLLDDLVAILPADHPLLTRVQQMRVWLQAHETHQLNLSLDFKSASSAKSAVNPNAL